jgi:hypothetical protein
VLRPRRVALKLQASTVRPGQGDGDKPAHGQAVLRLDHEVPEGGPGAVELKFRRVPALPANSQTAARSDAHMRAPLFDPQSQIEMVVLMLLSHRRPCHRQQLESDKTRS